MAVETTTIGCEIQQKYEEQKLSNREGQFSSCEISASSLL